MARTELDRTDLRIIELLQQDGRLSNQEVAERVALSPSPCLRRIRRLEQLGVIRQYVALIDPARIGLEKRGKMPMEEFRARVQTWPEVAACYAMTGDMDYLLRVHVEDLEHFSRFVMEQLLKQPGVVDVKSSFALDRSCATWRRPPWRAAAARLEPAAVHRI